MSVRSGDSVLGKVEAATKNTPIVFRLGALTTAPMLMILTLVIANRFVLEEKRTDLSDAKVHPQFTGYLREVANSLFQEQNVTGLWMAKPPEANRSDVLTSRDRTDDDLRRLTDFYYTNAGTLQVDDLFKDIDQHKLIELRTDLDSHELDLNDFAAEYNKLQMGIVWQAWAAVKGKRSDEDDLDSRYAGVLAICFATAFGRLEQAAFAARLTATPDDEILINREYHSFAALSQSYLDIFSEVAPDSEVDFFRAVRQSDAKSAMDNMAVNLDQFKVAPDAQQRAQAFDLEQWDADHSELVDAFLVAHRRYTEDTISGLDDAQADINVRLSLDLAMICLIGWSLCWLCVGMWLQRRNATFEQKKRTLLIGMLENLNRVSEYATHFSFFDLTVPHIAQGRRITPLEGTLMRAMAALKVVAPAITPTIFPERFHCETEAGGKKRPSPMEVMMNCLPGHAREASQSRAILLTEEDVNESRAIKQMCERARLGLTVREVTVMTVSTTFLHRLVTEERETPDAGLKAVDRHFPKFLSAVEQVVIHNNGLMHRLCADRLVCIWNAPRDVAQHQVQGCRAALQASAKLRVLTTPNSTFATFDGATVATAVTTGEVVVGNVGFEPTFNRKTLTGSTGDPPASPGAAYATRKQRGSEVGSEPTSEKPVNPCSLLNQGMKTFELFGPCVMYGTRVVYFQKLHSTPTCTLCDERTAQKVGETFAVKPLELLRTGQGPSDVERIYCIVGPRRGKLAESQVKLEQYIQGFELFERRKLKEADKAFRAYTKVYGYDSSVERLQTLIGERKCIDDTQADEKKFVSP
eukprot:Hpha_TRINITY_DN12735_c0_g1::TRINITY_DN12735_c0_g1_i1::g.114519::m.114519